MPTAIAPTFDAIAEYALSAPIDSAAAYDSAFICLIDAFGRAIASLQDVECAKLLGPIVPGASVPGGARVPGTSFELDPVMAAFNIGVLVRAPSSSEGPSVHPADTLGAVLASADHVARREAFEGRRRLTMRHVLEAIIKAHEIQHALVIESADRNAQALERMGMASAAVAAVMLGATREQVFAALAHVWRGGDDSQLADRFRAERSSSARWAGGAVASRAVRAALMASNNEFTESFSCLMQLGSEVVPVMEEGGNARTCRLDCPLGSQAIVRVPQESMPEIVKKFDAAVGAHYSPKQCEAIRKILLDRRTLESTPFAVFMAHIVKN
jgi:2-methylcitrate dehydratase PrpD